MTSVITFLHKRDSKYYWQCFFVLNSSFPLISGLISCWNIASSVHRRSSRLLQPRIMTSLSHNGTLHCCIYAFWLSRAPRHGHVSREATSQMSGRCTDIACFTTWTCNLIHNVASQTLVAGGKLLAFFSVLIIRVRPRIRRFFKHQSRWKELIAWDYEKKGLKSHVVTRRYRPQMSLDFPHVL